MKKFEIILEEIKAEREKINSLKVEIRKETDVYMDKFLEMSFKEKVEYRKEHKEEKEEHDKKLVALCNEETDRKIKLRYMENNAKIALFQDKMPIILEVLKKYNGKPYGEKTKQKIYEEVKEKTNCSFYIGNSYGNYSYHINPINNSYGIECGTEYYNGSKKPLLVDNKIQIVTMEELNICYINRNYYENLDEVVEEVKRLHSEALKKQKELEEICNAYNKLTVDGVKDLYVTDRVGTHVL